MSRELQFLLFFLCSFQKALFGTIIEQFHHNIHRGPVSLLMMKALCALSISNLSTAISGACSWKRTRKVALASVMDFGRPLILRLTLLDLFSASSILDYNRMFSYLRLSSSPWFVHESGWTCHPPVVPKQQCLLPPLLSLEEIYQ